MKLSTFILAGSIAANVVLAAVVVTGLTTRSVTATRTRASSVTAAQKSALTPDAVTWTALQSDNLARERDQLRAQGFPPRLVRAILAAQIAERYAAQRKALTANTADQPFWRRQRPDPKTAAALRDLVRAERKELQDLGGPDPDQAVGERFLHLIPGLTRDKAAELAAIDERYNEERQKLYSAGPPSAADRAEMTAMDKQRLAEYAAVLTPQELEDYNLRASQTARQLQSSLAIFNPTEAEYRALYDLQSAFEAQHPAETGSFDPAQVRARLDAKKQLDTQIAAALGPERYAEYQRDTDYSYRTTTQLVDRLQLPPETADNLYAIEKEYQQKQTDVMKTLRTPGFNMAQARENLSALQQEATGKVTAALNGNAEALDAYKKYGGQWLTRMAPAVRTTPTGADLTIRSP